MTKATTDYAANIKTFVDQGYGIIVTVGFAMGDATTIAAKQYPKVKFIGVDQGVCIDETGKSDPTFACKGDPKTLLPNYQGLVFKEEQVGYLAGVLAASVSKSGVIGTVGGINTIPPVVPLHQRLPQRRRVGEPQDRTSRWRYVSTDITKAFNDPGTGKSIAEQMIGQKADVIFQVAGLSGAGRRSRRPAHAGVIGIGVDVDQSKSLPRLAKCILTQRREEARRRRRRRDRQGRGQDRRRRHHRLGRLDRPRSASACRRTAATTRTSSPRRSRPRSTRPWPG